MFLPSRVVLVAHCLLNPFSKVASSIDYSQAPRKLIPLLLNNGIGVIQLPCPELTHGGLTRWGQARSQYDHPFFRRHCRRLAGHFIWQVQEYLRCGLDVGPILGVNGSPCCGVEFSYDGDWGGELAENGVSERLKNSLHRRSGPGVFMEILREELRKQSIELGQVGIDENNLEAGLSKVKETLL